jgi:hypothetical protein
MRLRTHSLKRKDFRPADIDITLYGLRKWAGMVGKGNPTALHYLFAPLTSWATFTSGKS